MSLHLPAASPDADEPGPCFHRLARGEQLTLWCVRAIALGHSECPTLHRALQLALGSGADEAFAALFTAVRTLGWCAHRRFRLHAPGCDGVSEDEALLLTLFADAQGALATGEEAPLRARLDDVVEPRLVEGMIMTLQAVAGALEIGGYTLPQRSESRSEGPARTLH